MGYNHFRYARRIDAGAIGIYHNDMVRLLHLDKSVANTTTISGQGITGDNLTVKANTANVYPYFRLAGNSYAILDVGSEFIFKRQGSEKARFGSTGAVHLLETTTPTAIADMCALYTKSDNELYFQTGAGVEKTITTV